MIKIFLIIPFFMLSCSDSNNIQIVETIPKCESEKYIKLFSGDIIHKISENPKIEIIYSEDNSKKLCLISGRIEIIYK